MRKEVIGDCTLYLGDCLEVMPTLGKVDAVVTDPPYGVGFKGKVTKHSDKRGGLSYEDGEDIINDVVLPAITQAIASANRAVVFPGTRNMQRYPTAKDIGGIICPNGGGHSSWGFGCYHPVLFYGSSPHVGSRPTATVIYHPGMHVTGEAIGNNHPCPKPIAFMEWVLSIGSLPDETVLDPFMGSGTTGVACVKLGRRFIGIEINGQYFDIACRRIEEAYRQPDMFVPQPEKLRQEVLL